MNATQRISPVRGGDSPHVELSQVLEIAKGLVEYFIEQTMALRDRIGARGDDEPAYYIASGDNEGLNLDSNAMHVMGPDGERLKSFAASEFHEHLVLTHPEYSYAGQTSYQSHVMRANSLARINIEDSLGTPVADEALSLFRQSFGRPAHAIVFFDLARCIELVYAIERAMQILELPLDDEEYEVAYTPSDGEGYGLVEAPRGPLIYYYTIEKGLISNVELVIPTVHNLLAIERALKVAAERYVSAENIDMELENAVSRVVRAFDPCIAYATH